MIYNVYNITAGDNLEAKEYRALVKRYNELNDRVLTCEAVIKKATDKKHAIELLHAARAERKDVHKRLVEISAKNKAAHDKQSRCNRTWNPCVKVEGVDDLKRRFIYGITVRNDLKFLVDTLLLNYSISLENCVDVYMSLTKNVKCGDEENKLWDKVYKECNGDAKKAGQMMKAYSIVSRLKKETND